MKRWLLAGICAALLAPGCGIPARDAATGIADDDVPYGLLDPEAGTVSSPPAGQVVELCMLRGDQLVPVLRALDPPAGLIDIARALADVADAEVAAELRTSIVAADEIVSVRRAGGIATVDLAEEASQRLTADPLATIAQIVCTLTRQPGVGLVRFTVADVVTEVPRADGSLSSGPVSFDDYRALLGPG